VFQLIMEAADMLN